MTSKNKVSMIVGLGNPGSDYEQTRHNAGQWFVEELARKCATSFKLETKHKAQVAKVQLGGQEVRLVMPTTYMNESGQAISSLSNFFKISPEHILIAHDELDIEPGVVRLKQGGGHGGHNGLRDTIEKLGNNKNFLRLRIGVGHPGDKNKVTSYVLKKPSADDKVLIENSIDAALAVTEKVVSGELQNAMTELHTK